MYFILSGFSFPNIYEPFILSGFSFTNIHKRFTGQQGRAGGGGGGGGGFFYSLTLLYHFHPLHRHLDISRAITPGSSPLRIASRQTQTGNFWFPSASHTPPNLMYICKKISTIISSFYGRITFDFKLFQWKINSRIFYSELPNIFSFTLVHDKTLPSSFMYNKLT